MAKNKDKNKKWRFKVDEGLMASKKFRKLLKKLKPSAQEFQKANDIKKKPFLAAFAELGSIKAAGQITGVTSCMHRRWLKKDRKYRKLFKYAEEEATNILEDEARRRAIFGTQRIMLYKGEPVMVPKDLKKPNGKKVVYVERTPSDTLLLALLRANRPDKFRNNVDITSKGEQITYKRVKGVSPDDL